MKLVPGWRAPSAEGGVRRGAVASKEDGRRREDRRGRSHTVTKKTKTTRSGRGCPRVAAVVTCRRWWRRRRVVVTGDRGRSGDSCNVSREPCATGLLLGGVGGGWWPRRG